MARKLNYLNNKDILKEIHKSKSAYCSFSTPDVANYDSIVTDISDIDAKSINEARDARIERLAKEAQEISLAQGTKRKLDEFIPLFSETNIKDVVFRVMTWEHIPIDEVKQKKSDAKAQDEYNSELDEDLFETEYDEPQVKVKGVAKYVKVNFPPFQHFKIKEIPEQDTTFLTLKDSNYLVKDLPNYYKYVVGKSHWKGDVKDGEFSREHGQMTPKLAHMFMKLCERYATRSNWRGYTYNDEMRSTALLQLSQIGLQFDENKSDNPFAYYTAAITNSFTRVLNIEKRNQNIRDDILEINNYAPSYTRQNQSGGHWGGGGHAADE